MPWAAGGAALAAARKAAEDAVVTSWLAKNRNLSASEIAQMKQEMKEADSAAIITWLLANQLITGAPTGPWVIT